MGVFQRRACPMLVARVAQTLRATISGRSESGGEGSGDSEEDVVGCAGMLAEPIRLQSDYGM